MKIYPISVIYIHMYVFRFILFSRHEHEQVVFFLGGEALSWVVSVGHVARFSCSSIDL